MKSKTHTLEFVAPMPCSCEGRFTATLIPNPTEDPGPMFSCSLQELYVTDVHTTANNIPLGYIFGFMLFADDIKEHTTKESRTTPSFCVNFIISEKDIQKRFAVSEYNPKNRTHKEFAKKFLSGNLSPLTLPDETYEVLSSLCKVSRDKADICIQKIIQKEKSKFTNEELRKKHSRIAYCYDMTGQLLKSMFNVITADNGDDIWTYFLETNNTPVLLLKKDLLSGVVTFGLDPYPFIVLKTYKEEPFWGSRLTSNEKLWGIAKINNKYIITPLSNLSHKSPESQLEMALNLMVSSMLSEPKSTAVPVE